MRILILPGLYNSDPSHWQSRWEQELVNARRVHQQNWDRPQKEEWLATLSAAIESETDAVVLVAHSLGCALTAWWVASDMPGVTDKGKVKAALLVAPPDVARPGFPAPSFSPMPEMAFPFPVTVVASDDDPWCDLSVAQNWACAWGAELQLLGAKGHINGESGLGSWQQGQDWLCALLTKALQY